MSAVWVEILLVLLLIVSNGVLALAEIAVVSARRIRLEQRAAEGNPGARVALELAAKPTRFLSTVQIGITLIGILAGALSGATIAEALALWLTRISWIAPYAKAVSLGLVVLIITYLSLVIGELVPKRLALTNPERVAAAIARPLQLLSTILNPVVRLLTASTDLIIRLLGVRPGHEPPITVEEIKILLRQGETAGVFEPAEQDMIEGVFQLDDLRVGALVTPRTEIVWLDTQAPPETVINIISNSRHVYFPVAEASPDNVLGIVRGRNVLASLLGGHALDLKALVRPPLFVPESQSALQLLDLFKQTGEQMALVIDEHGGLVGMVTLTEIVEALVGDLPTPDLMDHPESVRQPDGSWLLDGRLPLYELRDLLGLAQLPPEATSAYNTLGGLVMSVLGRIPIEGDSFQTGGWRFDVLEMDRKRVKRVRGMDQAKRPPIRQ